MKYLLLFLTCLGANAATLQFYMTNSLGQPDTNWFQVIPVGSPILANGGFNTKGIAIKCFPDTNGFFQTNVILGNYLVTNKFLGSGSLIGVPDSPLTFNAASLAISGFNTYNYSPGVQRITSSDGSVTMTPANGMGTVDLKSIPGLSGNRLGADWYISIDTNGIYRAMSAKLGSFITSNDCSGLLNYLVTLTPTRAYHFAACPLTNGVQMRYIFTNTVVVTNALTVSGENNPETILALASGASGPMWQIGTTNVSIGSLSVFKDLRFEGANGATNGVCIRVLNGPEPVIKNCELNGFGYAALWLSGSVLTYWSNIRDSWFVGLGSNAICILVDGAPDFGNGLSITDCKFNLAGPGIVISNGFSHVDIRGNTFFNNSWSASSYGVYLENGTNVSIAGNQFLNFRSATPALATAIRIEDQAAPVNADVLIAGNQWQNGNYNVYIGANVSGVNTNGNQIGGSTYLGGDGGGVTNLKGSAVVGTVPAATTATFASTAIISSTPAQALFGDNGSHGFTTTIPSWLMTNYINGPLNKLWNKDFSDLLAGTNTWAGDNITSGNWTNSGTWQFKGLMSASFFTTPLFTNNLGQYGLWGPSGYDGSLLSNYYSTNIVISPGVLAPTSNQTNYTLALLPGPSGNMATIYAANTNVFITFTGTNVAHQQRTLTIDCRTNTAPITLTFVSRVETNRNASATITNGFVGVFNFYCRTPYGTNVLWSDAGRYQ